MNLCLNLGIRSYAKRRLMERSTRRAISVIILTLCGVAAVPLNWHSIGPWLATLTIIGGQLVHIIDPDDFPPSAAV